MRMRRRRRTQKQKKKSKRLLGYLTSMWRTTSSEKVSLNSRWSRHFHNISSPGWIDGELTEVVEEGHL
jgi:hypothetical protein